ncbi:MAG TPA: nickel pincer cofactor biosynthesis protein LarB [Anaerolineae bacterium]|nr:nickel pincer cofactor biosynthesis protein LarB [Anaerolineae bacterium]
MESSWLRTLLEEVQKGESSVEHALERLRSFPYENLGFARLDSHRSLRTGFPEVVFCQGKTSDQVMRIVERLLAAEGRVMASRISPEVAKLMLATFPDAVHYASARMIVVGGPAPRSGVGTVLVASAGTADIPVADEAAVTAETLGSPVERLYDVGVAGIHRLLDARPKLNAANVLVVVAGMEGALASVVAGLVDRPVVAVPTSVGYGASFGGLAPLLTMLNSCAPGVAVVNIDNGFGAGCMAHLINQAARSAEGAG